MIIWSQLHISRTCKLNRSGSQNNGTSRLLREKVSDPMSKTALLQMAGENWTLMLSESQSGRDTGVKQFT